MKKNIFKTSPGGCLDNFILLPLCLIPRQFSKVGLSLVPGVILCAMLIFIMASCKNKIEVMVDSNTYYACSMDPQVVEYKPGKCPICKMELTPVKRAMNELPDEIQLSEQQIQLGNIVTDTNRISSIGDEIVLTAILTYDQRNSTSVSSRVMGRIERMYYKNLGEYVKKGAPLYDLYSEDLNNSKQEYLLALDKKNEFSTETIIDFDLLLQSAKNKLLLWGMSEGQIQELDKNQKTSSTTTFYSTAGGYITALDIREGDYIMEGGTVIQLTDLSGLWAEAQVYPSQLADMNRNSIAVVQLPDFEGLEIKGRIEFINPEINAESRINLIRVSIPNPDNRLKPGMPAYVLLNSPKRKAFTLPIDAVIRDGKGSTVWIKTGAHSFRNRMVQTGLESNDRIEITSGLKEGEIVVITGAYLLNSEYIFKKGTDPMSGHDMNKM